MGRLGAQGAGGAVTGFATTGMRYGDGTSSTEQWRRRREKQGRRNREERRRRRPYSAAQKQEEATQQPSPTNAKPEMATGAPGRRRKLTDGELSACCTIPTNYRIATRFNSQITPKFVW